MTSDQEAIGRSIDRAVTKEATRRIIDLCVAAELTHGEIERGTAAAIGLVAIRVPGIAVALESIIRMEGRQEGEREEDYVRRRLVAEAERLEGAES